MTKSFRYGLAILSVVMALTVRLALDPVLGSGEELLVFTLGILAATRFGGRGPGVAATFLSVILAWFFFVEPRYSFVLANSSDVGKLILLALAGAGISLMAGHTQAIDGPDGDGKPGFFDVRLLRRAALLGMAFVFLAILTHLLNADIEQERDRQFWVVHNYEVLDQSQALSVAVENVETEQRNYLLTGDERYVKSFQSALEAERRAQTALIRLTADNPGQRARLMALDRLVQARFAALQRAIAVRQKVGLDKALSQGHMGEGEALMDQCRAVLGAIKDEERGLLAQRSKEAEEQALRTHWVLGLGSGALLLLLVIAGAVIEWDVQDRERTRRDLRKSKERLHMALDSANAGAWEWDLRTNENVWSDQLWKLYGMEPNSCQPSYEAWRQTLHPDDRDEAARVVREAARTGAELNIEYRVGGVNSPERWLLVRGQPLRDAKGQPERFLGIALDITHRKLAEEALRQREENLRRFTEAAPVSLAMFDREMRYLAASRRFREDYRLGERELAGHSHYEIFPEIPEPWREIHRRCLDGAVERHDGEEFRRADGSAQWIRWEIQPWRKASGEIGGIVLFSEDITGQRVVEQALQKSEVEFRTLANAIPQLCWMANASGWIYWYNQRWYDYTGTTPELMEGWGWQSVHDPEMLPKVMDRWKASIETGEPFDMVFPLRGADGTFRSFLTRIMPVRDSEGKVVHWFGTNTDISEQLAAETALRRVSEQRRLAMEAAGLGAWDYRFQTGEVFWDERCRAICGMESGERTDFAETVDRIHPEDRGNVENALQQAIAGDNGGAYSSEFRVIWPDSSVHWILSHGRAHLESEGGQSHNRFTGVLMDITRRKEAELEIRLLNTQLEQRVSQRTAELVAANKELEAFSYSVSHDLRSPLRGIDGWSLALAEDYAEKLDARAQQYLDRVRTETQRMGLLIDDMLQLSRISSSEMRTARVDLTRIAREIAAELAEANAGRRIEFRIEEGLAAPGDARLLRIALTNLLANAVKFTGPRDVARIEFGAAVNGSHPAFCVRDNGVGFDMTYAGALFGAFQRLHKASEFPGTGIGLAIVQRVIHRHMGQVWADAQREKGASFYFTIGTTV